MIKAFKILGNGLRVMRILTILYVGVCFYLLNYCPDFIYTNIFHNPILLFLLRGSLVFVIGTPMVMLLIKEANDVTDTRKRKYRVIISILMIINIILFLSFFIPIVMFQFLFGYFQMLFYNPFEVIVPILIALSIHYLLLRKNIKVFPLEKKITFLSTLSAWVLMLLILMSTLVIFQPPNNYIWYQNYLTQKYKLENVNLQTISSSTISRTAPRPPAGLLLKYLFFGERSVDSSCLND